MIPQYPRVAVTGIAFRLDFRWKDASGVPIDVSSGYTCRVVLQGSDEADIVDTTSPDATITLSDGANDSANISISIPKSTTSGWEVDDRARYLVEIWPTASADDNNLIGWGPLSIQEGIL